MNLRKIISLVMTMGFFGSLQAQYVYTINADSVKITNCDSAELILENHTQNIPGFLFNTGNGRTIFKRAVQPLGNGSYVFGADTLQLASPNSWIQGGNRFGATGVLGTLDNNHLDLYTNDSPRLRLTNTGHLLLGTTTDYGYNFLVNGTGFMNSLTTLPGIDTGRGLVHWSLSQGSLIGNFGHSLVMQDPSADNYFQFQWGFNTDLGSPVRALTFQGGGSGNIQITSPNNYIDMYGVQNIGVDASYLNLYGGGYNGQPGVVITRDARSTLMTDPLLSVMESDTTVFQTLKNGNVGIGTATPTAQLHTTGSVRLAGLTQDSTQTNVIVSDANGNLFTRSAASLAAAEPIRSSLTVNGSIKSKNIIISPDVWADYVFDSTYRLTPLNEVDSYIHKEHHLPGVPAAAEIQKQGLDVGSSQTALLKKIEELTLYTIEQDKKLSDQQKEMDTMKARLEKLEALIAENTDKRH